MDSRCLGWVDVLLADLPPSFSGGHLEDPDTKDAPKTFSRYYSSTYIIYRCDQLLNFSALNFG